MGMVMRGEVHLAVLDPTVGAEIRKSRPCLIISPDEMNQWLRTVIVAPLTSKGNPASFRIAVKFQGKQGLILLDQIRVLDKSRLVKKLGAIRQPVRANVFAVLQEMFVD